MPRKTPASIAARRRALLDLLAGAEEGMSLDELEQGLPGRTARRTLHEDLAFFKATFPDRLQRAGAGDAHGTSRVAYRWVGAVPHLLDDGITWLTEEELLALVAARGLLHHEDRSVAASTGMGGNLQGLAAAVHGLIARTGLAEDALHHGRHLIAVSRFGAAPVPSATVATCLGATAGGQGLRFTYRNLAGVTKARWVAPQRLVLIRGEWYLVAWEDVLRMFRLARMEDVTVDAHLPPGLPPVIASRDIDDLLDESFYATGSPDRRQRRRVVLAVSPGSWPFIEGRTWGINQRMDEAPKDLPPGWRRLSFTTTGLQECRHWILGQGLGLKAESPQELVDWLRDETTALAQRYAETAP